MRKFDSNPNPLLIGVVVAALWAVYLTTGLLLENLAGFLSVEGTQISARAILAARSDPLTFASLGIPQPPLPFMFAIPFAALTLPHPALWASALVGAVLTGWFLFSFRSLLRSQPFLLLPLALVPLLPGVFQSATTGTSTISALLLALVSTQLAARFALEQQNSHQSRDVGQLSAWTDPQREQSHSIRFLWAAALALGLACLGKRNLIAALPIFLVLTPLLLPAGDRRNLRKILTVALLLYLPMLTVQALGFAVDFLFTSSSITPAPRVSAPFDANAGWFLLAALPLAFILVRLRNLAVTLLCAAPFVVEWAAASFGSYQLNSAFFSLAALLAIMLLLLGVHLRRFTPAETRGLTAAIFATTLACWILPRPDPIGEDAIWHRLAAGTEIGTFAAERRIVSHLANEPTAHGILVDESAGFPFITLLNDPSRFILTHQRRFRFAIDNPHIAASHALMQSESESGRPEQISRAWGSLGAAKRANFHSRAVEGDWHLLENELPLAAKR